MRKAKLYKNIMTNEISTFAEIKNEYEVAHECEIEVDDNAILEYIHLNLSCVGGNIQILTHENNLYLKWCNEYANYVEAERGMSDEEIDESIRDIVVAIENGDNDLLESVIDNLYIEDGDGEANKLHAELSNFLYEKYREEKEEV